jgi:hypothetical protein
LSIFISCAGVVILGKFERNLSFCLQLIFSR